MRRDHLAGSGVVAIVPVYDEDPDAIEATVRSLGRQSAAPLETILVDDGSSVPLPAVGPDVRLIRIAQNVGISAARNRAAAASQADFICFVNCHVVLEPEWLEIGSRILRDEGSIGMVGGVMSLPDTTPRLSEWRRRFLEFTPTGEPRDVDWLHGHALLMRRAAFDDVSGFDETLRVAGEDVDLGNRLRAKGWKIRFDPRLRATLVEPSSVTTLARKCLRHQGWWLGEGDAPRTLRQIEVLPALLGCVRSWKWYSATNLRDRRPTLLALDAAVVAAQASEITRCAWRQRGTLSAAQKPR
jgi:cellulose synthase/poly-beta-1,6-N-acetylglucosamine synthase-like glycosyltransferase